MKPKVLIMLGGIPGSGKTTWAKAQTNAIHISRDEIRLSMLGETENYFSKEKEVFTAFIEAVQEAIDNPDGPKNIIMDATHLNTVSREKVLQRLSLKNCIRIDYYWFKTPLSVCILRNSKRTGRALVPAVTIEDMYYASEEPTSSSKKLPSKVYYVDEGGAVTRKDPRIFFTSDLHFNHGKEFVWQSRGFSSVQEMNQAIVDRWNATVAAKDDVYVLGDIAFGKLEETIPLVESLNGKIHIVLGNHDTETKQRAYEKCPNVVEMSWGGMVSYLKKSFLLTHFPLSLDAGHKPPYSFFNLFGHTHQSHSSMDSERPCSYHVGVDSHDCYPVEIETIVESMRSFHLEPQPSRKEERGFK